jgi:hypothetical protein
MSRDEWAAHLRRLNPDMDAENFERWLNAIIQEDKHEARRHLRRLHEQPVDNPFFALDDPASRQETRDDHR